MNKPDVHKWFSPVLSIFDKTGICIAVCLKAIQVSYFFWALLLLLAAEYWIHSIRYIPPAKLLGHRFSTPMPLFCLICTIISNKPAFWISTRKPILSELGSILVDGFDTRLIPRNFSCGYVSKYLVQIFLSAWCNTGLVCIFFGPFFGTRSKRWIHVLLAPSHGSTYCLVWYLVFFCTLFL